MRTSFPTCLPELFEAIVRDPVPPSLKRFIWDIQSVVELAESEREIALIGGDIVARLVATDDCLPPAFATPGEGAPRQFHLYADAMERFCVVSTVLAPGQSLPILREPVWELAGLLRGAATRQRFALPEGAPPEAKAPPSTLGPGKVESYLPKSGEGIRLANASADAPAILIQVYGGEIGTLPRAAITADGGVSEIVTGYANPEGLDPYDILSIQTQIVD